MTTYKADFYGDEYTLEADFSQASSPIVWCGSATQYQVADFRHDSEDAFRTLLEEAVEAGGDDPEDCRGAIEDAVAESQQ